VVGDRLMADKEREDLTSDIEEILRKRTYDRHPADEELFEELLDEIDAAVTKALESTRWFG
jgi:hypothetical protein